MTNRRDSKSEAAGAAPILDVRPAADFEKAHAPGAVNIPLEQLRSRIHELPSPDAALIVFDIDRRRARWAASRLRARGREVTAVEHAAEWTAGGPVESGPSRGRLWRPHDLLVEAVGIAREMWPQVKGRRALDIACGTGRDAAYLAMEGFAVEAWDILPDALERCKDLARRCGVTVTTTRRDVEADPDVPPARYDMICCFNFLHRPMAKMIAGGVRPGGLVVYETFVRPQPELFGRPSADAHVLQPGELLTWFQGWHILRWREGLSRPRRITAALIAQRPSSTPPNRGTRREKAPGREE